MATDGRRVEWKWIDSVSYVDESESEMRAHRRVQPTEWYFEHHFESYPVLPGVLLVEIMAQTCGYLQILRALRNSSELAHYVLVGTDNSRFYRQVRPGDLVDVVANLRQGDDEQVLMRAEASVGGKRVARTDVLLHRVHADWLAEQDAVVRATLRRILPQELQARYTPE